MSYKKEIIGFFTVLIVVYVIILLDNKINKYEYDECDKCKNNQQTVSFKVPLLIAILVLGIYKFTEPYIHDYLNSYTNCITRQNIITDMADF